MECKIYESFSIKISQGDFHKLRPVPTLVPSAPWRAMIVSRLPLSGLSVTLSLRLATGKWGKSRRLLGATALIIEM